MWPAMKAISQTNANGVSLLSQERFEDAARSFRSCLEELHSILLLGQKQSGRDSSHGTVELEPAYKVILTDFVIDSTNDRSSFFLYNKVFVTIPPGDDDVATETKSCVDEHLFSAIFMYNLGLCFHLRGLRFAGSRRTDLQKALSVYKMALKFLRGTSDRRKEQPTLLELALYNNMVHIHLERNDNDAFRMRLSRMNEMLLQGRLSGNEQEESFFALNLLVLDQTLCLRAASAA